MTLQGKVAIVTGAASGIGLATAGRLAREGAGVSIWDINAEGARAAAAELTAAGHRVTSARVDVSKRADIDAAVAAVRKEFGGVTILVNNAGVPPTRSFLEMTEDEWDRIMNINL